MQREDRSCLMTCVTLVGRVSEERKKEKAAFKRTKFSTIKECVCVVWTGDRGRGRENRKPVEVSLYQVTTLHRTPDHLLFD